MVTLTVGFSTFCDRRSSQAGWPGFFLNARNQAKFQKISKNQISLLYLVFLLFSPHRLSFSTTTIDFYCVLTTIDFYCVLAGYFGSFTSCFIVSLGYITPASKCSICKCNSLITRTSSKASKLFGKLLFHLQVPSFSALR